MIHSDIHDPAAPEPERRRGRRFYSAVLAIVREAGHPLDAVPDDAKAWHEDTDDLPLADHAFFLATAGWLLLHGEDDPARGEGVDADAPTDRWVSVSTSGFITEATGRRYVAAAGDRDAARVVAPFVDRGREAASAVDLELAEAVLGVLRPRDARLSALRFAHVLRALEGRDPTAPNLEADVEAALSRPLPAFSPAYANQESLTMCDHPDLYTGSYDAGLTRLYAAVRHLLSSEFGFDSSALPQRPADWASGSGGLSDAQKSYFLGVYGLLLLDGIDDPAAGGQLRKHGSGDVHVVVTDTTTEIVAFEHLPDVLGDGENQTVVRIVPSFKRSFIHAVQEYVPNKALFERVLPLVQEASTPAGGTPSFKAGDLAGIARRLVENEAAADSPQLRLLVQEAFSELLGGRIDGRAASIPIDLPDLEEDSNDTVVGDNITGLSALYYCAMLEQMKFFAAADKVAELFVNGAVPISRGPAGQELYDYIRDVPNRFTEVERRSLYGRTFGLAMGSVDVAMPNREFIDLWIRFLSTASYHRRQVAYEREEVTKQSVAKAAQDLAVNLSLHGYGVGYFAAVELQRLVVRVLEVLGRPDVLSAFGATTRWQLVERVSDMYLGGAANGVKHRTMATSGSEIIKWLGTHAKQLGPNTWDPNKNAALHEHIDRWLAVTGTADKMVERHAEPISTSKQPTIPSWSFSGMPSIDDAMKQMDAIIPEAK